MKNLILYYYDSKYSEFINELCTRIDADSEELKSFDYSLADEKFILKTINSNIDKYDKIIIIFKEYETNTEYLIQMANKMNKPFLIIELYEDKAKYTNSFKIRFDKTGNTITSKEKIDKMIDKLNRKE